MDNVQCNYIINNRPLLQTFRSMELVKDTEMSPSHCCFLWLEQFALFELWKFSHYECDIKATLSKRLLRTWHIGCINHESKLFW
jgi:hypothetical protein